MRSSFPVIGQNLLRKRPGRCCGLLSAPAQSAVGAVSRVLPWLAWPGVMVQMPTLMVMFGCKADFAWGLEVHGEHVGSV